MQDRLPICRTSDLEIVNGLMARRTSTETTLYLVISDSIWHLLFILGLFIFTTYTFNSADGEWLIDGLRGVTKECLYIAYETACGNLRFRIFSFFALFIFRSIYDTHQARPDDATTPTRVREEGSDRTRCIALAAMGLDIILSISFILQSVAEWDVRKHHHDTSRMSHRTLTTQH